MIVPDSQFTTWPNLRAEFRDREVLVCRPLGGPVALLDKLQNELKMEMQEDDMEEKTAQKDYEEMMKKSADKRAMDSKTIVRGVANCA